MKKLIYKKIIDTVITFIMTFILYSFFFHSANSIELAPKSKAEDIFKKKFENLSEEQFKKLDAFTFFGDIDHNGKKRIIANVEKYLSTLKYYGNLPTGKLNSKLTESIKKYQKDLGNQVTGSLTMQELSDLSEASALFSMRRVIFKTPFFLHIDNQHAQAAGSWVFLNDTHAFPIHSSRIECQKQTKKCVETRIELRPIGEADYISIDEYYYDIKKWDDNEIIAEDYVNDRSFNSLLIFNKSADEVKHINSINNKNSNFFKNHPEFLNIGTKISKLSDSLDVAVQHYDILDKKMESLTNPEYNALLKNLFD
jgi:hypothetical protein